MTVKLVCIVYQSGSFIFIFISLYCYVTCHCMNKQQLIFSILKLMKSGFQFGVTGYITLWLILNMFFADDLYTLFEVQS